MFKDDIYSVFAIGGFRLGLFAYKMMGEERTYGSNCLPSIEVESLELLNQKQGTDLKSDQAAVDYLKKADPSMHGAPAGFTRIMPTDGTRIILDIAESLEPPLFLHERSSEQDFIKLMKQQPGVCRRSVVHCFTGSRRTAYRYLQMGCYIGITGRICDDRRNKEVVEAIKSLPLDRLMIETDAPYLKPLNIKGMPRRNVPVNIKYVAEKTAAVKNTDVEAVEQAAFRNTRQFFRL